MRGKHCVRVRGSPNEKINQYTKETTTGQKIQQEKYKEKRDYV